MLLTGGKKTVPVIDNNPRFLVSPPRSIFPEFLKLSRICQIVRETSVWKREEDREEQRARVFSIIFIYDVGLGVTVWRRSLSPTFFFFFLSRRGSSLLLHARATESNHRSG